MMAVFYLAYKKQFLTFKINKGTFRSKKNLMKKQVFGLLLLLIVLTKLKYIFKFIENKCSWLYNLHDPKNMFRSPILGTPAIRHIIIY